MKATPLPSAEQLTQFDDAVQALPQTVISLGRIAAERASATFAAKAASTRRELARATAAGGDRERLQHLRALAAAYAEQAARGAEQLRMAATIEKIGAAYGQRPAAYGRAVDDRGRGHANLPISLATERGETLAEAQTDDEGYFAISLPAGRERTGNVLLRVGEGGSMGSFPLTTEGRLLPPREIRVTGPRRGRVTTASPHDDPSKPDGPPKPDAPPKKD